jgi:hypothetical protein
LRDGLQTESPGIVAANFNGEGVVEAEGRSQGQVESLLIVRLNLPVNFLAIALGLFFQDRREGRASVFGIDVDAATENGLMADVSSGEIKTAFDGKMGLGLNLLGDDFAEDELLGKVLGTNHDAILAGRAAPREQRCQQQ